MKSNRRSSARRKLTLEKEVDPSECVSAPLVQDVTSPRRSLYSKRSKTPSSCDSTSFSKRLCTDDNKLPTKSFYGSQTRSYMTPLERSKLTTKVETTDVSKSMSPQQHNKKTKENKKKKSVPQKAAKKSVKPNKLLFGKYSKASISPQSTTSSLQTDDTSDVDDDVDKENVKQNKFFKSRKPRLNYPPKRESDMKDRKLLLNKKLSKGLISQPSSSSSLKSASTGQSSRFLLADGIFDNSQPKTSTPVPTTPKRKAIAEEQTKKLRQSPRFKSDSPRLNKLRTKLKDETNTRDLLNSLFDIDFIEGTPPKQLNAGVLRTEDGLDVACIRPMSPLAAKALIVSQTKPQSPLVTRVRPSPVLKGARSPGKKSQKSPTKNQQLPLIKDPRSPLSKGQRSPLVKHRVSALLRDPQSPLAKGQMSPVVSLVRVDSPRCSVRTTPSKYRNSLSLTPSKSRKSLPDDLYNVSNSAVCGSPLPSSPSECSAALLTDASNSPANSRSRMPSKIVEESSSSESDTSSRKLYSVFTDKQKTKTMQNQKKSPTSEKDSGRLILEKDGKEQMMLDFGQKLAGHIQCGACGMTYMSGDPLDETTHSNFHHKITNILKFPGWKNERILQEFHDNERIIMVLPEEKKHYKKKIDAVKSVVDEELGFVVDKHTIKDTAKIFLYISSNKKIVGFCIAEVISQAYRAIPGSTGLESPRKSSLRGGSKRSPWCCSDSPERALCGVNRIWVLSTHRKQGIATKLVDCVRSNFLLGYPLSLSDIAFTDPTPDGRQFASHYCNTSTFLVYKYSHD